MNSSHMKDDIYLDRHSNKKQSKMTHEGSDKDLGNNRPANGDEEAWGGSWV